MYFCFEVKLIVFVLVIVCSENVLMSKVIETLVC